MPAAATLISTSPAFGDGVGNSARTRAGSPFFVSTRIAFMFLHRHFMFARHTIERFTASGV
jgi:hypothetical protein